MKNNINITLSDETVDSLRKIFKDDDEAILNFVSKAIEKELQKYSDENTKTKNDAEGLEDYLKSGKSGSRDYGIKGQGW